MVDVSSNNKIISVSVKNENNTTSVIASNNNAQIYEQMALAHANSAKQYAEQSEQSALKSAESANSAKNSADSILKNENVIAIGTNINNINSVANSLSDIDKVNSNIEDITTVATNITDITSISDNMEELLAVETNKDIVLEKTQEAKNYSESASNSAQTASAQAAISVANATIATEKANNAQIWAEGTDEEVQTLGGVHSSKGWADLGNFGGTWGNITGNIENQTDLINKLNTKVDKVEGKTLSTNDFTNADKNKLDSLSATYATKTELETKQDKLTAGENITITNNVISSVGGCTITVTRYT